MTVEIDHAGLAALSICEALLLALNDQGLMPQQEILGVLRDAAASDKTQLATTPKGKRTEPLPNSSIEL